MPHKCRNCEKIIPNESENLLSGCPACENQSWEYVEDVTQNNKSHINQKTKIQKKNEDKSQQAARTEFVDADNLPSPSVVNGIQHNISTDSDEFKDKPVVRTINDVDTIQKQLNRQYEGIKVVRNGKYKINLTELYRGNDYIIEIGDDGAYTVSKVSQM